MSRESRWEASQPRRSSILKLELVSRLKLGRRHRARTGQLTSRSSSNSECSTSMAQQRAADTRTANGQLTES